MPFWCIASREEPNQSSSEADERANPKRDAPAVVQEDIGHECRRDRGTHAYSSENHAVRDAPLLRRNPTCDELIRGGIDHRFSNPKQKARENQCGKRIAPTCGDRCGKRGENSPPDHAACEHAARAPLIREPTCRRLEERVAQKKKCRQPAELHIAEVVIAFNACCGDAEIDAGQKRNGAQNEEPGDEQPADAGFRLHALCARKSCTRRSAIIFSSPGCNWKEFMPRPSRPPPSTMEGLPDRNSFSASLELKEIFRGSQ